MTVVVVVVVDIGSCQLSDITEDDVNFLTRRARVADNYSILFFAEC